MIQLFLVMSLTTAVSFIPTWALYHRCPDEDLSPCSCKKIESEVKIQCVRVTDNDFKYVLSHLELYVIDDITIRNVPDLNLESNVFRKLKVHNINIINSNILTFALFKTFRGLIDLLNSVKLINSTVKTFELSSGSQFIRLRSLKFESTNVKGIFSKLISQLPNYLERISVIGNADFGIEVIRREGFSKFPFLIELNLSHNRIINLKRSMFQNPAKRLRSLNLAYNRLSYLPEDIFTEMPRMEFLYLNNNPLISMGWTVFKPIWRQLTFADLRGIDLHCNCDLVWIIRFRLSTHFKSPTCKTSEGDHLITDLSISDLCPTSK